VQEHAPEHDVESQGGDAVGVAGPVAAEHENGLADVQARPDDEEGVRDQGGRREPVEIDRRREHHQEEPPEELGYSFANRAPVGVKVLVDCPGPHVLPEQEVDLGGRTLSLGQECSTALAGLSPL